MKLGFSADMYWVDGQNVRTESSLAVEASINSGWEGLPISVWRINEGILSEWTSGWWDSAIQNICNALGPDGTLVAVTGGEKYFETYSDSGAQIDTHIGELMTAWSASTGKPNLILQIGNEPYTGATPDPTHAELSQTYMNNVIDAATSVRTSFPAATYPKLKFCLPPLPAYRTLNPEDDLRGDWNNYVKYVYNGSPTYVGLFDYVAHNSYRWDHSAGGHTPDYSYNGPRKSRQLLEAVCEVLSLSPWIMELGLHGGSEPLAASLKALVKVTGGRVPTALWRVGPGDDYDMMATGAMPSPTYSVFTPTTYNLSTSAKVPQVPIDPVQ